MKYLEIEAMDWQPTERDDVIELSSIDSATSLVMENKSATTTKSVETMGETYDAVSENLLRLSAEKKRDKEGNSKKWCKLIKISVGFRIGTTI